MYNSPINQLNNTPFTLSVLAAMYPETKHISDKARRLEQDGRIIRLKRDLYVRSSGDGASPSTMLIANHLYGPSYVSLHTALRHYGLIPERVYETQSMTIKHSRSFDTPLGLFSYHTCPTDYFPIGIRQEKDGNDVYLIASPEKALCDLILKTTGVHTTSSRSLRTFLESDLRLDMELLKNFDTDLIRLCRTHATVKNETITHLINLIDNEQRHL